MLLLRRAYIDIVSPRFAYFGLEYHPASPVWEIAATLLLLLLGWSLISVRDRPARIVQWSLFLFVVVPNLLVPFYILGPSTEAQLPGYVAAMVLGYLIIEGCFRLPLLRLPRIRISPRVFWAGLIALTVALEGLLFARLHGTMNLVSLQDVYGQRTAFRDLGEGSWIAYTVNFLGYVANPFFMARGLSRRRYGYFLLGAGGEVLIYAIGAWKTYIFLIVFLPLAWLLLKGSLSLVGARLVWLVVAVFAIYRVIHQAGGAALDWLLTAFVMVRGFYNSALITAEYVSFFSRNPFTHFAHVRGISHLIPYPYPDGVINMIGRYWSGRDTVANGHLWADGFAGWGVLGVLIVSLLGALIFWIMDSVAAGKDPRFVILVFSVGGMSLANASLFTWMLTHGIAATIVLLYLLPKEREPGRDMEQTARGGRRGGAQAPREDG